MPSGAASYGSANPAPSRMARSASKPFRPALQLNAPVGFSCHFLLPSTCVPLLSIPLVFSPLRALCPTERLQLLCYQRIAHPFPCNGECASFFLPLSDLLTTEKEDSMSRTEEILKRIRSIVAGSAFRDRPGETTRRGGAPPRPLPLEGRVRGRQGGRVDRCLM